MHRVPVQQGVPALLGELDKVVPTSSHRFTHISAGEWMLSGAPAETVAISFTENMHDVKTVSCVLNAAGAGTLKCAGQACACA